MKFLPRLFAGAALLGVVALAVFAVAGANDSDRSGDVALSTSSSSAGAQVDAAESRLDAAEDQLNAAEDQLDAAAHAIRDVEAGDDAAAPAEAPRRFNGPKLDEAPPILGVEEELRNLDGWLQSDIDSLGDLDGKVHIVQFWTFGCFNCKNTLPNLIHIDEVYGGDDFEIVGVHAPEFEREKDPDNIIAAAENLGVTWPIALDTEKTNFRSWQEDRRFWPRTYVIDQNGDIRLDRIGEGAYEKIESTVAWLLEEGPGAPAETIDG